MQEWAEKFYKGKHWQKCRQAYIAKRMLIDGGCCEECLRKFGAGQISEGEIQQGYIVHHIEPLTEENISNPMIALNEANFSFECKRCHDEHEGHGIGRVQIKCNFDENGRPIDIRKLD